MKPGIQTTEFWMALVVAVLLAVGAAYTNNTAGMIAGAVASAFVAMGYGAKRTELKKGKS